MQVSEFKAWFDGYTEAMNGTPTKAQWARIKERVAEIDGKAITERVFIDRYWPHYIYQSSTVPFTTCSGTVSIPNSNEFCSNTAMYNLGKTEAGLNAL